MKIKLIKFKNVESTNDEAIKLIKKNILRPALITSERQSRGRGRMGKKWLSLKGNLFLSIYFEINHKKINLKQYNGLLLITCYPFDALISGTNFRYIVVSSKI